MKSVKYTKKATDNKNLINKIIGLGENSPVKSYYPELKKKLKELERFRFLMNGVDDFILIFELGPSGKLLDCNKAFKDAAGIKEGKNYIFNDLINLENENKVIASDCRCVESNEIFNGSIDTPNGDTVPVEFSISPLCTDDERFLVCIGRDITERLDNQKKLKELNEKLEKKVESAIKAQLSAQDILIKQSRLAAMGEMIGNIAHQWRQPLTTLSMYIQDLLDSYDHDELDRKYLDDIVSKSIEQIIYMSNTIDNFRNYFNPGKEKSEFEVCRTVGEAVAIVEKQFKAKNIDLRFDARWCNSDCVIYGYANEFKQVILNILSNAFDAVSERVKFNPDVNGYVSIDIENNKEHMDIIIKDNGGGISQKVINKIFEPYFSTKEEGEGTGIGLYMSKMIIEKNMDGRLNVSSEKGNTEFLIKILKK